MTRADALVLVVPEYNHGYPGLLKHVLDTNLKEYIHKAAGVVRRVGRRLRRRAGVENLIPVLRELGLVPIFWDVNFTTVRRRFDEAGNLVDDSFLAIDEFLAELLWMAETLRSVVSRDDRRTELTRRGADVLKVRSRDEPSGRLARPAGNAGRRNARRADAGRSPGARVRVPGLRLDRPRRESRHLVSIRMRSSTRASSAVRGRRGRCSAPTPRSASPMALLVLAQAVLLAHVAARGIRRRVARRRRAPLVLLARRRRARARWPGASRSRAGAPPRACSPSCASTLVERGLRRQPAALDGAESAEVATAAVAGVDALETLFARYLPQLVLAVVVPVAVLALVATIDLIAAGVMLLTLPLVPVFMWLIGAHTERRARERWQALRAARRRTSSTSCAGCRRCGRSTAARRRRRRSRASATSTGARRWARCASRSSPGAVLELAATLGDRARRGHGRRAARRRRHRLRGRR